MRSTNTSRVRSNLPPCAGSDLGIVRWYFTLAREWLEAQHGNAIATVKCHSLSRRLADALSDLGLPRVKRMFDAKRGSITAAQYRHVKKLEPVGITLNPYVGMQDGNASPGGGRR